MTEPTQLNEQNPPGAQTRTPEGERPRSTGEAGRVRRPPLRGLRPRHLASAALALALGAVLFIVPMPYVVESPGPTFDVGGSYRGTELLSVSGADPSTGEEVRVDAAHEKGDGRGELRMVTVSEQGGPGRRLNLVQLIHGWLSPHSRLTPYSTAYPGEVTKDQVDSAQSSMMKSSQSTADVAAMEALGYAVPATTTIRGAVEGSDAAGKVRDGDVLVSITDEAGAVHPADSASMVFRLVKTTPAGSVLTLRVERDGEEIDLPVTTIPDESHPQGSRLGIYLDVEAQAPLDVRVNLESVGGPSAGLIFSLAIIDKLSAGDLTGGRVIAGTGTMSYDGEVGPIGGIVQKMHGAKRDGAEWFLAPVQNCRETIGEVPDGLRVVAVSSLAEAREAVEAIAAGDAEGLRSCEAAAAGEQSPARE